MNRETKARIAVRSQELDAFYRDDLRSSISSRRHTAQESVLRLLMPYSADNLRRKLNFIDTLLTYLCTLEIPDSINSRRANKRVRFVLLRYKSYARFNYYQYCRDVYKKFDRVIPDDDGLLETNNQD